MDEIMSQFVFVTPPKTALNKSELDTIIVHRKAFNVVQTADLNPTWKTEQELLAIAEADLTQLYVLYEFVGEVYQHLSRLKCRIISPLVILQSHTYELVFPMKTIPVWAQSLYHKTVCAVGFNVEEENEIREKVIKLGGQYKKTIGSEVAIVVVGSFTSNDQQIQVACTNNASILNKEWLDKVHQSSIKLEEDYVHFFEPGFLTQYQIRLSSSSSHPQIHTEKPVSATITSQQVSTVSNAGSRLQNDTRISLSPIVLAGVNTNVQSSVRPNVPIMASSKVDLQLFSNRVPPQPIVSQRMPPHPVVSHRMPPKLAPSQSPSQRIPSHIMPSQSPSQRIPPHIMPSQPIASQLKKRSRLDLRQMEQTASNSIKRAQGSNNQDKHYSTTNLADAFASNVHIPSTPFIAQPVGLSNPDVKRAQNVFSGGQVKSNGTVKTNSEHADNWPPMNASIRRKRQPAGSSDNRSTITSGSRQSSILSDTQKLFMARARSPEYVSQGPVMMNDSITDDTTSHAVIWDDKLEKTTQPIASRAMMTGMSQFFGGQSNNQEGAINEDDIFMDDEETELLSRLTKK